jgi:hypothetical protein
LASACRGLDIVRTSYEHERQPETLKEASRYLVRMTRGRYPRVWTPFGQRILMVDDAEGHALPVEALSRGTREQLFLSLRLALAAYSARHGAPLPMVLDDVLVNFDAARAQAAAEVLTEFAAAGHQVLVFTCHEHIVAAFENLQAAVGRLPSNTAANPPEVRFSLPAARRPKALRESTRKRRTAPREEDELVGAEPEAETVDAPLSVPEPIAEPEPPAPAPEPEPESELPPRPDEPLSETEDADLVPLVPLRQPKRRKRAANKPAKSAGRPGKPRGVFDADFFDSESAPTQPADDKSDEDDAWMAEDYDEDAPWEE